MNDVCLKAMQNQIDMVKNELRNEMKTSIQTSLSNQTNEIKNMMASLLQMNTASTLGSGSLPGNTVANPKGELKAITTRSGLVTDGPTVPTPPKSLTPEEDECVKETYTDPDLAEYTIKVPPPPVQKPKPPIQRHFVLHTRDSPPPNILGVKDASQILAPLPRRFREDSDLKDSIDQTDLTNLDDLFVDPTPEMFTDEHAPDYSLPLRFDMYPDDFLEIESDADNFYDDLFDSKREKIKESELLIDQLDLPCDIFPYSEYDSFSSQNFSRDDDLPSPDNEDKVFNPGILIHEKSVTIITLVAQVKKLAISYASLVFEDFDPPFYELLVFKDVPTSMRLLLFSSENEEKVFKPGIYTFEKVQLIDLKQALRGRHPMLINFRNFLFISELKCKALADLGASINLMPLSVWKKLGLPDLIPTRMTLELANHAICTPDGIARDVFIPVGKFTFPADFVVVDYESDPRVSLILGRPFLRTARALIDVHGEEMILCNGDERLTLNMKHDTTSYSNHPHRESVNLINIFNIPSEDCLEVLISNKQSGNPTFSLYKEIASSEVTHKIHDSEGCTFLSEEFPNIDSFNDIHPHFDDDPLSGSTTYSSNSLLEEFTDKLALITYPPDYDDNLKCDIDSDLREIEFLLYQGEDSDLKASIDQTDLANLDDLFVDPTPEMFTDEHAPDYSFLPRFDVYPDDLLEIKSDADNFDDDPFDSKGEKIKESELLIDQLDLPCDILSEYDSFNSQDFSRDDDLPSPDNEDKVFNPGILILEKSVKTITRVAQEKKLAISYASLVFEDFNPPIYEPFVFKDVPNSMRLLSFSSENEEKVFKPGIYTSEKLSSILGYMKTLANGFYTQVFISSV
nr:reverse transcriptase domain-containing protein [Tanacetum cinerariifolium]